MHLERTFVLFILFTLLTFSLFGQTYPFAKLEGSTLDTSGWFLAGDAKIGDTQGDTDNLDDELILCPVRNFRSGACYFKKPVNITSCQKWNAEFDFRIWEGSGADGLSFFFLNNPPASYVAGGGMGIPPKPLGLIVGFDTWQNCSANSTGKIPKIQLRIGDGKTNYSECPNPPEPTKNEVFSVRRPTYNHVKITYDFGNISVYLNDTLQLTGNFKINFAGYFGLTASTGGSTDMHSVKNFVLYTQKPLLLAPDAGPDRTLCNGGTTQIGKVETFGNYSYKWFPVNGLSDSSISNPNLQITNTANQVNTITYFITKDTVGTSEPRCAFADEVKVTILPKLNQMPFSSVVCSKNGKAIGFNGIINTAYRWSPARFLSSDAVANPTFLAFKKDTSNNLLKYIVTATHPAGCSETDTIKVNQLGRFADAGQDVSICGEDSIEIGSIYKLGNNYSWFQISANAPNFKATIANSEAGITKAFVAINDSLPQTILLRQIAVRQDFNCSNDDTVSIRIFPKLQARQLLSRSICPKDSATIGSIPQSHFKYQWQNTWQISDSNFGLTKIYGFPILQSKDTIYYRKRAWSELESCNTFDSVRIRFKQSPAIYRTPDQLVCPGDSLTLGTEIAFPGYFYNWSPSQNLSDFNSQKAIFKSGSIVNQSLAYVLTNTLENCSIQDSVNIKVWNLPQFQVSNPFRVCSGVSKIIGPDSLPGYRYKWFSSSNLSADSIAKPGFSIQYNASQESTLNYLLRSTETASTCNRIDTVKIVLQAIPIADAGSDKNVCSGDTISVGVASSQLDLLHGWTGGNGIIDAGISPTQFSVLSQSAQNQELILKAESATTGCFAFDTVKVKINPLPAVVSPIGRTSICMSDSSFNYAYPPASRAIQSTLWNINGGNIVSASSILANVKWQGPDPAVWIQVTDSNGCKNEGEKLRINLLSKPVNVFISGPDFLCPGVWNDKVFQLQGEATSALWFSKNGNLRTNNALSTSVSFDSLASNFEVSFVPISDKNCKGDTVKKQILVSKLKPEIYSASVIESGKVELLYDGIASGSEANIQYVTSSLNEKTNLQSFNETTLENLPTKEAIQFLLTAKDKCNIERKSEIHQLITGTVNARLSSQNLEIETKWSKYLGNGDSPIQYELYQLDAGSGKFEKVDTSSYFAIKISDFSPLAKPIFKVKASWLNSGINRVSWSDAFETGIQKPAISLPNLFSPNGDGKNDSYFIPYLYWYPNSRFTVINRWGKTVHSSDNYQNDWNGSNLEDGVYFIHLAGNQLSERSWLQIKR